MAKNRIEVITSVERRRRWSAAEKARLLAAIGEPGAVASEIARDAGVDVSLLYRWRRQLAMDSASPTFVPVQVSPDPGRDNLAWVRLALPEAIEAPCARHGLPEAHRIARLKQRRARQARSRKRFNFGLRRRLRLRSARGKAGWILSSL